MNIERILVTGRLYKEIEHIVEQKSLHQEFRFLAEDEIGKEDVQWADAYVSFGPTEQMSNYKGVKWVHSLGAGVDSFLRRGTWDEEVLLTRTICSFGQRMSEYCLSYVLRDVQQHDVYAKQQKQKEWHSLAPVMLSTQTVVIYGTGEIGSHIGRVLSQLGVTVYGVSASGAQKDGFKQVVSRSNENEVVNEANWIISTLPLTSETNKIFNEAFFSQLRSACFMNVGRGGTVELEALRKALETGFVRQAVLDVFEEEPLPKDLWLWNHPNVAVTPHISAVTTPEEAVACFVDTLERIEKGQPLSNKVNVQRGY
ncbi:D-2-hydroxyacid dehydrogenase [Bacillus sp. CGMCC 1.16541]|uniref:D-2-hydroxyacid dehydrogenase n=1 Tax=Bacillus sp. CGMCC 1.16541 TaxID=2185143 RepID=UPI000D7271A8|nr:D-2-hydroxyacid dehydrogenase [Bacillus sp. CGMCC 1.16541]